MTENQLMVVDNSSVTLFKEMSIKDLETRKKRTPKRDIKIREGKGGQSWKYVTRLSMRKWLDTYYPGWSFEIIPTSVNQIGNFVHIAGTLTVIEPNTLLKRTFTCFGAKEAIIGKDGLVTHPYLKSAESDAFKRCVVDLGGFNDVYGDAEVLEDEGMCNEDDLGWYFDVALPYFKAKFTPSQLLNNINKFTSGIITKNMIITNIPELNKD